jgi:histidinol dehydrogenase
MDTLTEQGIPAGALQRSKELAAAEKLHAHKKAVSIRLESYEL